MIFVQILEVLLPNKDFEVHFYFLLDAMSYLKLGLIRNKVGCIFSIILQGTTSSWTHYFSILMISSILRNLPSSRK